MYTYMGSKCYDKTVSCGYFRPQITYVIRDVIFQRSVCVNVGRRRGATHVPKMLVSPHKSTERHGTELRISSSMQYECQVPRKR
jgi:hypothetical protein